MEVRNGERAVVEPRLPRELHRVLRPAAVATARPTRSRHRPCAAALCPRDAEQRSHRRAYRTSPTSAAAIRAPSAAHPPPRGLRLVVDRSAGGGRRMIQLPPRRGIIVLQVSTSRRCSRPRKIEHAALEAEIELDERRRLAARVSKLKRQLRGLVAFGGDMAPRAAALDACPSRHRGLPLRELAARSAGSRRRSGCWRTTGRMPAVGSFVRPDDEIVRPITTEKDESCL